MIGMSDRTLLGRSYRPSKRFLARLFDVELRRRRKNTSLPPWKQQDFPQDLQAF